MIKKLLIQLKRKGFFRFIPDKLYYELTYYMHCEKRRINWKNPKTYSEKLNWLKLYDRRDFYHTLVDKYEVRNYIKEIIGQEYLIPLLGVYNCFDDINFDALPEKFVLKCTHDSGSVRIVEKINSNVNELKKYFDDRLAVDFFHYSGREWPYRGIKPQIIAEKFLETETELTNYKFHCFNGIPKFVVAEKGFNSDHSVRLDHYDLDFNILPFSRPEHEHLGKDVEPPKHMGEMLDISSKLSWKIPYIRVDLYEVNEQIYFSELTLYPGAGFVWFEPEEWNYKIGDMIDLSKVEVTK